MAIHIKNPPEAKPERISRLVTRIESGDIKVPVFQRHFVWKQGQMLELLDSIYRGFPIGSLLFWLSTEKLATERNLAGFVLPETPERYPRNYILDGQQRLTTIYGVLRWDGTGGRDNIYSVSFDLENKKFIPTPNEPRVTQVPMNVLLETRKYLDFQLRLTDLPDSQALLDESDVLLETFREYAIPVVTVTEATVEHVSSIFERINNTATRLTVFDLMVAATWSETFDLRDVISKTQDELKGKDFEDISPVAVLQILASLASDSTSKQSILDLRKKSATELNDLIPQMRDSVKRAVDFLITEANVKSSDFLPYERQLVALSVVFSRSRKPSASDIDTIRRWFWRTSFSERYRRGGEGLFDEDLNVVVNSLTDSKLLDRFGKAPTSTDLRQAEFRRRTALTNAYVALLASQHPRNLVNGTVIDTGVALSSFNRKEFHHIFPQAYLKERGHTSAQVNSLANICILSAAQNKIISDREPAEYMAELESKHGTEFVTILESNLIPSGCVEAFRANDYDGFLTQRADCIAARIGSLL